MNPPFRFLITQLSRESVARVLITALRTPPARLLITPLSRERIARLVTTALRTPPAQITATVNATPFSVISRLKITALLLAFTMLTTLTAPAQDLGDFILPEKTASTGRVTNRYWPKGVGKLWGTDASSLPQSITIGSGLTLTGSTLSVSASGGTWGSITGTLSNQTDLNTALGLKAPLASPTFTGTVTIPSGASISGYLTTTTAASTYQPLDSDLTSIAALTTTSHGRGLLTGANAAASRLAIGLGPDDDFSINNITAAGTIGAALFTGSGQGLTNLDAGQITGNLPVANLNSGTGATGSTFWRGDGTWATPAGGSPGGSSGAVQYNNAGAFAGVTGITLSSGSLNGLAITGGSVSSSAPLMTGAQTWSNGLAATLVSIDLTNANNASSSGRYLSLKSNGTEVFGIETGSGLGTVNSNGNAIFNGYMYAGTGYLVGNGTFISFSDGSAYSARLRSGGSTILGLVDSSTGGASFELTEMTAPAAPASNKARLYIEDNGSGKTRLMVIFPSGAAQQIAIEP